MLVHEFKDHYSLQPTKTMSIDGRKVQGVDSEIIRSPPFPQI